MIESHGFETRLASDSYTDLNSLQSIRSLGRENKTAALEKVAKQFESMLVRMMMKSMRDANQVFAKDNMLSSAQGDMYQQMYDDQLALSLSEGKGLGISDVMVKQLQRRFGDGETSADSSGVAVKPFNISEMRVNNTAVTHLPKSSISEKIEPVVAPLLAEIEDPQINDSIKFDGSAEGFITHLYDMASHAADKLNVSPQILLAQAALETGWGKKISQDNRGESSFNLFNIKASADWQGDKVDVNTLEFVDNLPVREKSSFRSYQNLEQSFDDYVSFISGRARYQSALKAENDDAYIKELSMAGYATDPLYAEKVSRIASSVTMQEALKQVEVAK